MGGVGKVSPVPRTENFFVMGISLRINIRKNKITKNIMGEVGKMHVIYLLFRLKLGNIKLKSQLLFKIDPSSVF